MYKMHVISRQVKLMNQFNIDLIGGYLHVYLKLSHVGGLKEFVSEIDLNANNTLEGSFFVGCDDNFNCSSDSNFKKGQIHTFYRTARAANVFFTNTTAPWKMILRRRTFLRF